MMIRVYHGPMYSGKTKELVREYGNGSGVIAFRPAIDNRYGSNGRMYSKERQYSAPAASIDHTSPAEIMKRVNESTDISKVIIDEASFFFPVAAFLKVIDSLTKKGKTVVIGGLAYDANRTPWGPILELLTWNDVEEIALTAKCDGEDGTCRNPAIWSYAKAPKKIQLEVGAEDLYGASCDDHYLHLHVPNAQ